MSKWHLKKKKIEARRLEKRLRKAKQHKKKKRYKVWPRRCGPRIYHKNDKSSKKAIIFI